MELVVGSVITEVLAFLPLKDVVTVLTVLGKHSNPSFFPSEAHKRELMHRALHTLPLAKRHVPLGSYFLEEHIEKDQHHANMITAVVTANRPINLDALRAFVGFVKDIPSEIEPRNDVVVNGSTCTFKYDASGLQLCVPCTVCPEVGHDDFGVEWACGTIVLTQCPSCEVVRDQCSSCGKTCLECDHIVCNRCAVPTTDPKNSLCNNCGCQCGGCHEACRKYYTISCQGVSTTQPCPLNLGDRCHDCNDMIKLCESCHRYQCAACCAASRCESCRMSFCATCDDMTGCFDCGIISCSYCQDNEMIKCKYCRQVYCEPCFQESIMICVRCNSAGCMECSAFDFCPFCKEWYCNLPACAGMRGCSSCEKSDP